MVVTSLEGQLIEVGRVGIAGDLVSAMTSASMRCRTSSAASYCGVSGSPILSIFQVAFPGVFVGYFVWHEKPYSAAIVLFWVGQSILNVWVYAADAVVQQLVLTSGMTGSEGSFHDWNYLLTTLGLIDSTPLVSGLIRMVGTIVILAAGALSVYYSFSPIGEEQI